MGITRLGIVNAYHRTGGSERDPEKLKAIVKSILQHGYKPGSGDMYGPGWYFTYDTKSQFNDGMSGYGQALIAAKVDTRKFLILDYRVAKVVYGDEYSLVNQLINTGVFNNEDSIPASLFVLSEDLEKTFSNPKVSADRAVQIWVNCFLLGKETVGQGAKHFQYQASAEVAKAYQRKEVASFKTKDFHTRHKIRGIIFSGNHDGNVIVSYRPDLVKVESYAITQLRTDGNPLNKANYIQGWASIDDDPDLKNFNLNAVLKQLLDSRPEMQNAEIERITTDFDGTPEEALDDILAAFPWMFTRKCSFKKGKIDIRKGKLTVYQGIWEGGDWEGDFFGEDDVVSKQVGNAQASISLGVARDAQGSDHETVFKSGTFKSGYFGGLFTGGVFQGGVFQGTFQGGLFDVDSGAGWGANAKFIETFPPQGKLKYGGKLYPLDKDPLTKCDEIELMKDPNRIPNGSGAFALDIVKKIHPMGSQIESIIWEADLLSPAPVDETTRAQDFKNAFKWFFSPTVKFEKASFRVTPTNDLIMTLGTWKGGDFLGYSMEGDVVFKAGRFMGHQFLGTFENGWFAGDYFNGTFKIGTWARGTWGPNAVFDKSVAEGVPNYNALKPIKVILSTGSSFIPKFYLPMIDSPADYIDKLRNKSLPPLEMDYSDAPTAAGGKLKPLFRAVDPFTGRPIRDPDEDLGATYDPAQDADLEIDDDDFSVTQLASTVRTGLPFNEDVFYLRSLTPQERDDLYAEFQDSYVKAVGTAWDQDTFEWKAAQWEFYGSLLGGVAARKQNSGMLKINASYGDVKEVMSGFREMIAKNPGAPIWGAMTEKLAKGLEIFTRKEFKIAPAMFTKAVIPHIKGLFGAEIKKVDSDGGLIVDTPAGEMKKFFIANKAYYKWVLDNAVDPANAGKIPVPQIVLKPLIGLLKMFI